jgi:hypothetical protein
MTLAKLEERLTKLEKTVESLSPQTPSGKWWVTQSGQFAGDPIYEEIVRRGREYRESLRPSSKGRRQ